MSHDSDTKDFSIPTQPVPAGAEEFSQTVQGLLDGQQKDEATVSRALGGMDALLDVIAAGLYSMASMLVGEGEDSIRLVEEQPQGALQFRDRVDFRAQAGEPGLS
jgi:hypothetical protein